MSAVKDQAGKDQQIFQFGMLFRIEKNNRRPSFPGDSLRSRDPSKDLRYCKLNEQIGMDWTERLS